MKVKNKATRFIISFVLMCAMIITSAVPAFAAGAEDWSSSTKTYVGSMHMYVSSNCLQHPLMLIFLSFIIPPLLKTFDIIIYVFITFCQCFHILFFYFFLHYFF